MSVRTPKFSLSSQQESRRGWPGLTNADSCVVPTLALLSFVSVGECGGSLLSLPPEQWWVSGGALWCLGGDEDEIFPHHVNEYFYD